jgi:hypothetical protein
MEVPMLIKALTIAGTVLIATARILDVIGKK